MKNIFSKSIAIVGLLLASSCSSDDNAASDNNATGGSETTGVAITAVVQEFFKEENGVTVTVDEDNGTITITSSTGLPDHKSPYFDVNGMDHELYEDFPVYSVTDGILENFYIDQIADRIFSYDENGEYIITYHANNNDEIAPVQYSMQIPMYPTEAATKMDTELSAIGIVLNGVPFFNNLNRDSDPLGGADVSTLDTAGGHPGANLDYHYHVGANFGLYTDENPEIAYGTIIDEDNLVGFMRDGFPLYGQQDQDGSYPDDLDAYGGHIGVTEHFPDGIYHYHASTEDYLDAGWYVLKSGQYYGTPGTFSSN
ncbi:YHYH protein [uncultured Kriegella sp.]|uniref:YHYH protein n=1 Tax=uncultured Kriegella sp. TaxID=1798910 RepID=UPI0030DAECB2|tara:strand:+ start:15170 stop:16105 length:936 start_codon:yes stop_codon:yes gene_type:complete